MRNKKKIDFPIELTFTEKSAIKGVQEREKIIQEKYIEPLAQEWNALLSEICKRIGISVEEVGSRYIIDLPSGKVVEIPQSATESS